jgi:hypothetical protein
MGAIPTYFSQDFYPAGSKNLFIMTLSEKSFIAGAEFLQNNNNG